MATLVTGGTGFVGSNIVKALAERGHEVVCFDLIAPDALFRKYLEPWAERVTSVQGDILNAGHLQHAAAQQPINKIVHAAVFTPSRASNLETDRSRDIVGINIEGTANLLDLARRLTLDRFLYVSSEAVYGETPTGVELVYEDAPLEPRNLYAVSKYASELLTRRYGELHGFQTASVRLSYPYGPMERATGHRSSMSLIYKLTGNVVRGEWATLPLVLARSWMVAAPRAETTPSWATLPLVLAHRGWRPHPGPRLHLRGRRCHWYWPPSLPHDVYNVSAGRPITLDAVIDALRELRPSLPVIDAPSEDFLSTRPEQPQAVRDVSRIKEDLGYTPSYDIAAGLKAYLEWREDFPFRD